MKISIVTTTYNRKNLLKDTVRSVALSVVAPLDIEWEHIVYDDDSTDGTAELFATRQSDFEHDSAPTTIFIQGKGNEGPSYGRNRAIDRSTGDWIFFLDDDDIVLQRTLHNFGMAVLTHPDATWFISDFLRVNENLSYKMGLDYWGWAFKDSKEMLTAIFDGNHFIQGNVLFKKSLFLKNGPFDESRRMAEDIDLYIRFLLANEMPIFCPFISHLHRLHGDNASRRVTQELHKQHILALKDKYRL